MAEVRAGFLEFFDREYLRVVRFVMRCGASFQDAEDAAQEAFAEAWALTEPPCKWAAVDDPQGWIRAVAVRRYLRPPGPRNRPAIVPVPDVPETGLTCSPCVPVPRRGPWPAGRRPAPLLRGLAIDRQYLAYNKP